MTDKIIFYAIIGIAVTLTMVFLKNATGKEVKIAEDGCYKLRMNKLYGIIGVVCVLMGLIFLISLPFMVDEINAGIVGVMTLVLAICWGSGIPCLLYYRNHRISFDDRSIHVTDVYGKSRTIEWSQITDANFSAFSGLLVLKTENEKVKVHQHLVGLSKFMKTLENKIQWTTKELKVPIKSEI